MTPSIRKAVVLVALFTLGGTVMASLLNAKPASGENRAADGYLAALDKISKSEDVKPVDNMHHFMEYIYGPVFNRLKGSMEKAPADKAGWTQLKSDSLILAEVSILLAERAPENKDAKGWKNSAKTTYTAASATYQAARKKDFDGVKKNFAEMINGCKACHEEYRK